MSAEMDNLVRFAAGPDADHVWVYRVCDPRGYSYGGRYQWPTEAGTDVEFDDWSDDENCGGGGHGWLLGMGHSEYAGVADVLLARGLWYLLRVPRSEVRVLSRHGKVKFRSCRIERVGYKRSSVLPLGWHGVPIPEVGMVDNKPVIGFRQCASWRNAWALASNTVRVQLVRQHKYYPPPIAPTLGQTVGEYLTPSGKRLVARGSKHRHLWHGPYDWGDLDLPHGGPDDQIYCDDVIRGARVFMFNNVGSRLLIACRGEIKPLSDWGPASPPFRWLPEANALACFMGARWAEVLPSGHCGDVAYTDEEVIALSRAAWELPK